MNEWELLKWILENPTRTGMACLLILVLAFVAWFLYKPYLEVKKAEEE